MNTIKRRKKRESVELTDEECNRITEGLNRLRKRRTKDYKSNLQYKNNNLYRKYVEREGKWIIKYESNQQIPRKVIQILK